MSTLIKPNAVVFGLGPIGLACARAIRSEGMIKLVGLVDIEPAKLGKTVEEITGKPSGAGDEDEKALRVVSSIDDIDVKVDVAVLTTTSHLPNLAPLIKDLVSRGINVISSCEEMVYPWYRHPQLADEIDAAARAGSATVLGTGVNPGFALDLLPVTLASMLRRVNSIRCVRRVDAALRRESLQAKVGATMTVEKFNALKAQKQIGHAGLAESVAMLGRGLGRKVEFGTVTETLEPVLAETPLPSALGLIAQGRVAGIHNTAVWEDQGLRIELDLTMAVGLSDPRDVIEIDGPVQLRMKIPGSIPGDSATVAAILNNIVNVYQGSPGFKTMLDVPPAGCHNLDWTPDNLEL